MRVDQDRGRDQELSCVCLEHRIIVPYEGSSRASVLPQFASADSLSASRSHFRHARCATCSCLPPRDC
jgi:hypothetical protein